MLRYSSVFAGVGGFDVGFDKAGLQCVSQVEIDRHCNTVLSEHWPDVPRTGDICETGGRDLGDIDLICGGFPCFVEGTLVLTKRGLLPIEEVVVGDHVVSHRARWQEVTATRRKVADTVRVKGLGHPGLECTPDHRFWTSSGWLEAKNLPGQWWSSLNTYPTLSVPPFEPTGHDREPPPWCAELAWVVGRWVGDGWVRLGDRRSQVFICCARHEAAELAERLAAVGLWWTRSEERTTTRFIVSSSALARWLDENFSHGAATKTIPAWLFGDEHRRAFLDGYVSADGSANPDNPDGWKITTVSKKLAVGTRMLALSLGCSVSLHHAPMPATDTIEGREVNQRDQWQVVVRPHTRKNRRSFSDRCWRYGIVHEAPEQGDEVAVIDLTVAGDESFLADGICVHNCQDVSKAKMGGRQGLDGARSGLYWQFVRLLDEYTRLIAAARPLWVIIENVPGLLTSNGGRDLGAALAGLADLGYLGAYRVVDSGVGFGVPQRRRRLVIVGRLGDGAGPAAVLHEPEGGGGNPREGHEGRRPSRPPAGASAEDHLGRLIFRKSRRARSTTDYETWVEDDIANCVTAFDVGDTRTTQLIVEGDRCRRLTPTEYERIMGFPDGWTASIPETARHKTLGNAVATGLSRWLAERIVAVESGDLAWDGLRVA